MVNFGQGMTLALVVGFAFAGGSSARSESAASRPSDSATSGNNSGVVGSVTTRPSVEIQNASGWNGYELNPGPNEPDNTNEYGSDGYPNNDRDRNAGWDSWDEGNPDSNWINQPAIRWQSNNSAAWDQAGHWNAPSAGWDGWNRGNPDSRWINQPANRWHNNNSAAWDRAGHWIDSNAGTY